MNRTLALVAFLFLARSLAADNILVLQSDFGVRDGAVAAMKGVAMGVSKDLVIHDLTHEIPAYNIWEAALRLDQAAGYWPQGTVFVSVVDPGVGTARRSVVLATRSGHYFVTPDNGTLTFVAESLGIRAVREIDEAVNRLANSEASYTFHGRDVYAYTGARLAAGVIAFDEVGTELPPAVVSIPHQRPVHEDDVVKGNIPVLDVQFGNVWTNIDRETFGALGLAHGDVAMVAIKHGDKVVFRGPVPYHATFGAVEVGQPLIYLNSLNNVALALNQGDFAARFGIESGSDWAITISQLHGPGQPP